MLHILHILSCYILSYNKRIYHYITGFLNSDGQTQAHRKFVYGFGYLILLSWLVDE